MNKIFLIIGCTLAITACSKTEKKYESPKGYDFNAPVKYEMKSELKEISGIAFYPGLAQKLYAIQDEDGKLFYWKVSEPESLQQLDFGKPGDYEDVGMTKNHVIVLRSDGTLFIFPFAEVSAGAITTVKKWKDIVPAGEYESLYVDGNNGKMIILCKNCSVDKGNSSAVSGYELQLEEDGTPVFKNNFTLNTSKVKELNPTSKRIIKPSAVTYNSKTNEWFIVASVNKMLLIADQNWNIKQTVILNPSLFPQPEGISFDIDNNLYISNEAGKTSKGTVLKFPFKPSRE